MNTVSSFGKRDGAQAEGLVKYAITIYDNNDGVGMVANECNCLGLGMRAGPTAS